MSLLATNCTTNFTYPHTGDYANTFPLLVIQIFTEYWYRKGIFYKFDIHGSAHRSMTQ